MKRVAKRTLALLLATALVAMGTFTGSVFAQEEPPAPEEGASSLSQLAEEGASSSTSEEEPPAGGSSVSQSTPESAPSTSQEGDSSAQSASGSDDSSASHAADSTSAPSSPSPSEGTSASSSSAASITADSSSSSEPDSDILDELEDPDESMSLAAAELVPVIVTVDGEQSWGGGYAPGSTLEFGIDADYTGPASQIRYTTDGSDPSGQPAAGASATLTLNQFIHLRVLATDASGATNYPTVVDFLFAPGDTHYISQPYQLNDVLPDHYQAASEITYGVYRFEGSDLGIADTKYKAGQGGWAQTAYSASGLPAGLSADKRSGESLFAYTPPTDNSKIAQAKTTRMMLSPELPDPGAHYALSFWLWQDTAATYPSVDEQGVLLTLTSPNGKRLTFPMFFTAQAGAGGWQQYFIDLTGHMSPDANGLPRFGFSIEGRGDKPLYIDDVGIVAMDKAVPNLTVPDSMMNGRIFVGENIELNDGRESFIYALSPTDDEHSQPIRISEDVMSGWSHASLEYLSGATEQWLVVRSQTAPGPNSERGALSFLAVPRLAARSPKLIYMQDDGTPIELSSDQPVMNDIPNGTMLTLDTDDLAYTSPDTNGQIGSDVQIYYTTDGNSVLDADGEPTANAILYTRPFTYPGGSMTIKAAAVKPTATLAGNTIKWHPSEALSWRTNLPRADMVESDIPSGTVEAGTVVTLSCPTPDTRIYYSTDATTPTRAMPGTLYTGPLTIYEDTVITAVAWNDNCSESPAATFRYELPGGGDIYEPNNNVSAASPLSFPFKIEATLHSVDDLDYYAFDFPGGQLEMKLIQPDTAQALAHPFYLVLVDEENMQAAASEGAPNRVITGELEAGRYYAFVWGGDNTPVNAFSQSPYTLSVSRTATEGIDFSEMNMVTAMNHPDAPGSYTLGAGLDSGGSIVMATAYLARWSGPVLEQQDPYTVVKIANPNDPDGSIFDNDAMPYHAITPQYHLSKGIWLDTPDPVSTPDDLGNLNEIKRALYTHGALQIGYQHASAAVPNHRPQYYYPPELAGQLSAGGHSVTLVGWDDNYPASELAVTIGGTLYTPAGDGAYIIKNSWGDGVGENGFFYFSYYSYGVPSNALAYYELESNLNYNAVYQYDILGVTATPTLVGHENQNYVYMKNVFTAEPNETLRAVGFYTADERQQYDVYIEQAGERQHVAGGLMAERGYHTLRLSQEVPLAAGQPFEVIVRLESTGSVPLMVPGEFITSYAGNVDLKTGYTFISTDGENWQDFTQEPYHANACIKAFAYNSALPAGSVAYHGTAMPEPSSTGISRPPFVDDPTTDVDNTGLGTNASPLDDAPVSVFPTPSMELPAQFDLREVGAVTPVENQGSLGSCWTFGAYGATESIFMRNNNIAYAYPATISLGRANEVIDIAHGHQTLSVSASVTAPDAIGTNLVYWSVTGDVGAVQLQDYISSSGQSIDILKTLGTGTVTITATSAADTTKSAAMTLTIVDSSYIPGLEDQALVSLPVFTPHDGKLDDEEWELVLEVIAALDDGQALVLRFNGEALVPKAVFEALAARGAKMALVQLDATGAPLYNVVFDGTQFTSPADFLLGIRFEGSEGSNALAKTAFEEKTLTQPFIYSHSGPLPGPATVSFPQSRTPFTGGSLHYYRYEDSAFTLEPGVTAALANNYVRLDNVTRCSEYRLSDAAVVTKPVTSDSQKPGDSPQTVQTGDETSMPLFFSLTLFSAAGLAALLYAIRRRTRINAKK